MGNSSALSSSVLVLNRFYMAIRIIDVRRALTLLYRDCAEVITVEDGSYVNYDFQAWCELGPLLALEKQPDEEYIRAVNFELQVPRLVRLTRYDRVPKTTVRFNRKGVFLRDNHQCQYCGATRPASQLSLDHVVPRSQGGKTTWNNIVSSCLPCNSKKGGRTPTEARMKLLNEPKMPVRNPALIVSQKDAKYQIWEAFVPAEGVANT